MLNFGSNPCFFKGWLAGMSGDTLTQREEEGGEIAFEGGLVSARVPTLEWSAVSGCGVTWTFVRGYGRVGRNAGRFRGAVSLELRAIRWVKTFRPQLGAVSWPRGEPPCTCASRRHCVCAAKAHALEFVFGGLQSGYQKLVCRALQWLHTLLTWRRGPDHWPRAGPEKRIRYL